MEIRQFIGSAVRGEPTDCRVSISEFPAIYKAVREGLRARGLPASDTVDMLWLNLEGLCPECEGLVFGSELSKLFMIRADAERIGWDRIHISGPGRAFRFCRRGLCLNEGCSSVEIVVSWRPRYEWFKQTRDVQGLLTVLEQEAYWFARRRAAEALGDLGSLEAVQPLIRALEDESPDVRWKAVVSLGRIADKSAIDSLRALLEREENRLVREAAEEAVEKIEGGESRS